jgi:pyridoxamine 5'-phosphate oxidase
LINFIELNTSIPYRLFKKLYDDALLKNQSGIEAIVISSYSSTTGEVDSRYVNLKYIKDNEWIFFSNYLSPKSVQFQSTNQISAVIYWESINVQIRMKAKIKKTESIFSDEHFKSRDYDKNILAIASKQSQEIHSYQEILNKVKLTSQKNPTSNNRPSYWGGFSFEPYYFEFWEGHKSRLNKRDSYQINRGEWDHSILQP